MNGSCNCVEQMNAKLAPHNAKLAHCFGITEDNNMVARLLVQTEKVPSPNRKRTPVPLVIATHCPFCGQAVES